ncbi:MAG TPA: serine kinase [Thermoflexia bacterium]|nr:serine kinase [Thermoflexia bacterium]
MKLREIATALDLQVQAAAGKLDVEVTGGYASDLLSRVLAKAQKGNIWVTLQAHPNIVAVASLLDLAGIVITEGRKPEPDTVEKANEKGVPILTTPHATFTLVGELAKLGVVGVD